VKVRVSDLVTNLEVLFLSSVKKRKICRRTTAVSPSPHANSFVIGTVAAVINAHAAAVPCMRIGSEGLL
jgi:hypothetical protein